MAHVVRISPQLAPELQVEIARPGNAGYYLADYGWHVPSLLEACDALLDERGFRGSAKAGISVFDDDFGLHAQQVAFLMKFRDLVERVRDVSGVYLTGRLQ